MKVDKIISGGQTGIDRAALDFALNNNIACGGWCPSGRTADDGQIDDKYPLEETPSSESEERTAWNVRDADGTLILCSGELVGGTRETVEKCVEMDKTYVLVDPTNFADDEIKMINIWLDQNNISVLNVAGQKESEYPGIYNKGTDLLQKLFN